MNKLQIDIFHLGRARIVFRKTLAFCGLMAISLTVACAPTPSNSGKVDTPEFPELELAENDGVQVKPESKAAQGIPQGSTIDDEPTSVEAIPPEAPVAAEPKTESVPATPQDVQPATQGSSTSQGGGTLGTAAGGKAEVGNSVAAGKNAIVERLNDNYLWAMMPTYVDTHKDTTGQVREHFKVSPGDSKELKEILTKMRNDLVVRGSNGERFDFEVKEQGTCGNENKNASTKSCDTSAPICLSLESIQAANPKADLEQSLRPVVMREFARQHCADESLAKQVEDYYNLPAIKNFKATNRVSSVFNRVRLNLVYLQAALTTGMTPNAGKYAQKIDSPEEICNMIGQAAAQAMVLQDQVIPSGFVQDPKAPLKAQRLVLTDTLKGMSTACNGTTLDREALRKPLKLALDSFDYLAQEFSRKSGMIIIDFSKHLWAHKD